MTQTTPKNTPALSFEQLEHRHLLAVALPAEAVDAESDRDPIVIEEVQLRVGDRDVSVSKRNDMVIFKPGETVEVVGIDFVATSAAEGLDGVIAFEGYLRQADQDSARGSFNYGDGRFGDPSNSEPIVEGLFEHEGLAGTWTLDDDINRMSLAMVRYFGDAWETHDRFFVNLQAGEPDLSLLRGFASKARDGGVAFGAMVHNRGAKEVTVDSEIDIYRADDLSSPVWVGTFTTTFGSGRTQLVRYSNSNPDDGFDQVWQPDSSGDYIARIYLDPENSVLEQNEDNNFLEYRFRLKV